MTSLRVLFATAELRPLVAVGGLADAASGLVDGLRRAGHEVEVVLPDYGGWELADERDEPLDVPGWAGPVVARRGIHDLVGPLTLITAPVLERPNPYVDAGGEGWPDNDHRFALFSTAVAAIANGGGFDVVQLNDWHTGLTPAFLATDAATVLTIHNLAHQGWADAGWLHALPAHRDAYGYGDAINVLAGAIRTVDAVVAVSPNYAAEIATPGAGMGLGGLLADLGPRLVGIRNGIDTRVWDPALDEAIPERYSDDDFGGKGAARAALLARAGWDDTGEPLIAMVTRLVEQKGVDLALGAARFLPGLRARLLVLGSGQADLAAAAAGAAAADPERVWFADAFDPELSHLLFAGADLLLMPSRFEPCGLAQMQAMAYGTIPVVTPVGGLLDTVADPLTSSSATGYIALSVDEPGVVDALHRAVAGWRHPARRRGLISRGMSADWSWAGPTERFVELYQALIS